jgi:cystathionine gamma-lyase
MRTKFSLADNALSINATFMHTLVFIMATHRMDAESAQSVESDSSFFRRQRQSDGDLSMMDFATKAIHIGQEPDPVTGAVVPPVSLSTTFVQRAPGVPRAHFDYGRSNNPTRENLEQCIAALEEADHALAFSSGLAATTTLLHLLSSGDHVICIDDVYGGTQRYFRNVAARFGITFTFIDFVGDAYPAALANHPNTRMVWLESPTNPTLRITDIALVAKQTPPDVILVVDNTFMTPYCQQPLNLGAKVVFHSMSKYLNGHSDVIMGAVALRDTALAGRLRYLQNALGAVPSPFDCYFVHRGLKTLAVRMERHCRNALEIAQWLEQHSRKEPKCIHRVLYPGLESHPQHEIAKRNAARPQAFGGMVAFSMDHAAACLSRMRLSALAESLGGVESLIELPALMTHQSVPARDRERLGIDERLVRWSVGIEDVGDLINDLNQALQQVFDEVGSGPSFATEDEPQKGV